MTLTDPRASLGSALQLAVEWKAVHKVHICIMGTRRGGMHFNNFAVVWYRIALSLPSASWVTDHGGQRRFIQNIE